MRAGQPACGQKVTDSSCWVGMWGGLADVCCSLWKDGGAARFFVMSALQYDYDYPFLLIMTAEVYTKYAHPTAYGILFNLVLSEEAVHILCVQNIINTVLSMTD